MLALLAQDWGVAGSFVISLCGRCCCSSKEERVQDPEGRLRVTVLDSGVPVRLATWEGGRTSPIEVRGMATTAGGGVWEARELNRREDEPLGFLACLVLSLRSLLMTSTKALLIDARFRDCRMELRVVCLDFGGVATAVLDSAGITGSNTVPYSTYVRSELPFPDSQLFGLACLYSLPHEPSYSFPRIIQKDSHRDHVYKHIP